MPPKRSRIDRDAKCPMAIESYVPKLRSAASLALRARVRAQMRGAPMRTIGRAPPFPSYERVRPPRRSNPCKLHESFRVDFESACLVQRPARRIVDAPGPRAARALEGHRGAVRMRVLRSG